MDKLYGHEDHEIIHVENRESTGGVFSLICSQSGEEHVENFENSADAERRFDSVCDILERSGWHCLPNHRLMKGRLH